MKIQYRQDQPLTAKTWFAKFPVGVSGQIQHELEAWQQMISEASVQGTEDDRELWTAAIQPEKSLWGRAQLHRNQANTMLSVLAGAIGKLRSGGDLTAKQLDHVITISQVMTQITKTTPWTFDKVKSFAASGRPLEDLQNRLFEIT